MSNRLKLRYSVILLVIGLGLIPTAYLVSGYVRDQVSAGIPDTLLTIQQGAIMYIEDNYIGLGIPELLEEIKVEETSDIEEEIVKYDAIVPMLTLLKNKTLDRFPTIINGSIAADAIYTTYDQVAQTLTLSESRDLFFNNYTFQDNFSTPIEGVSERMTGGSSSLNYDTLTMYYLFVGRDMGGDNYPGLIRDYPDDDFYGTGLLRWLEFYSYAEADIGTNRSLMETVYDTTWDTGQLQNLSAYILTYLFEVIVVAEIAPYDIDTFAFNTFYEQWTNKSYFDERMDISKFITLLGSTLRGFEAGHPSPTNITQITAIDLWDSSNSSSFLNTTGLEKWYNAYTGPLNATFRTELSTTFGITINQVKLIYKWLFNTTIINNVAPRLFSLPIPYGYGMSQNDYALLVLYEQWANGTIDASGIELDGGVKGFEAGIPTSTNITLDIVSALFSNMNDSSFINKDGILKWGKAEKGDITAQNELINIFKLDMSQLNLILTWLYTTLKDDVIPYIFEDITGYSLYEIAVTEFVRQWAFGALFESGTNLSAYVSSGLNFEGWEIGVPTSLNLDLTSVQDLWDISDGLSFINRKGVSYWLKAFEITDYYDVLKSHFNLDDNNMTAIYNWLMEVRDNHALKLVQANSGYLIDHYTLSQVTFMALLICGLALTATGIIFGVMIQFAFKKKR